ncbi:hypothetical protein BjapCC829_49210 (plasmid) [Bradyrhizobium barranii]|uniref:Uncharacterized protein n=1 Tax=Bradyrhizobium barranii TaxID=2992140 RepID=A0ABY3R121_9BRAD|nr:hypothetical protein [Bradyrhizobium japonicum]UFW91967.1 hypothetical protein BjapCC829_49210 [Bradyrhizobium japonicum]
MVAIRKLVRTFFILGPKFNAMDAELVALIELGEEPTGNIRITATEHSAEAILTPALATLLPKYELPLPPASANIGSKPPCPE